MHANVFALESLMAKGTAHHSTDVLVELRTATLAAGTVEVPTVFKNGQIIGITVTNIGSVSINELDVYQSDLVVTTGAITVTGKTGSTATVFVMIFARPEN